MSLLAPSPRRAPAATVEDRAEDTAVPEGTAPSRRVLSAVVVGRATAVEVGEDMEEAEQEAGEEGDTRSLLSCACNRKA